MKSAQILRGRINGNAVTTGALCTFHFWPGMVEVAINAGLDYLIIDLEHVAYDGEMVATACAIGRQLNFPILIRPPAAQMVPLRLAMDAGPCGLLVPYIETEADMATIRDAVYMKPRGKRRPGGPGNRWVSNYNYQTWKTDVEDDLIILPQIESKAGLEQVDAIARNPITTAIAVGPYDLSADLGVCYDPTHPTHVSAVQRIRKAGRDAGKNMWMIGDPAILVKQGFTFLCIAEPTMLMEASLRASNQQAKAGVLQSAPIEKPLP